MWRSSVVLALALKLPLSQAGCPQYTDCTDCLSPDNGLDCGWCSPDPAVFGNGTQATQCMDHTSKGWNCFNLYMHDGCVQGYTCDTSSGQCVLADPGEGDTLANCEATCSEDPPPTDTYKCDVENFTCVISDSAYSEQSCDAACSDDTPSDLIGLWRGLDVQTDFSMGEWDMNFSSTSVSWGPYGDSESKTADVAIVAPSLLRLTLTAPLSSVGDVIYASYSNPGYPTGPETSSFAIAIQADGTKQTPPTNVLDAMGDAQFDVYVMNGCNSWDTDGLCDFSPAFAESNRLIKLQKALQQKKVAASTVHNNQIKVGDDQCIGYSDCDTCLDDASGVCGWCDGVVTDTDGNVVCGEDGNGCCGGSDGFSQCNVAFRKTCPVICDYTNWTDPSCRAATTPEYLNDQTFDDCSDMPWCTSTIYQYCDTSSEQCQTLYNLTDCENEPDCDPENPVCDSDVCKVINYVWCDDVLGCQSTTNETICAETEGCDPTDPGSCDPTECIPQSYYTCNSDTYQCDLVVGPYPPTPYFNTSEECTASCVDTDLSGTWRGLRVDQEFVANEWDFDFSATSITFSSMTDGVTYTGSYVVGDTISSSSYAAATITVTLEDSTTLTGIISNDRDDQSAMGPVTKFMYLSLPLTASGDDVDSFDAGMAADAQEWVLMACLDDGIEQGCDFSSASPSA